MKNKLTLLCMALVLLAACRVEEAVLQGSSLWARTVTEGDDASAFYGVAAANDGSLYAAGYQYGNGEYSYSNTANSKGASTGKNIAIVKYDAGGNASWARSTSGGDGSDTFFTAVAAANDGVYAVGVHKGSAVSFSTETSFVASTDFSAVIIKYNSSGNALWGKAVVPDSGDAVIKESRFNSVSSDGSSVYAAGYQYGGYDLETDGSEERTSYKFGDGFELTSSKMKGRNAVLVKYDESGRTLWAKSHDTNSDTTPYESQFLGTAISADGSVYAVGYQEGNSNTSVTYRYGNVDVPADYTSKNIIIVKYSSQGEVQWAKTVDCPPGGSSVFNSVVCGDDGVYAAGYQFGDGEYTYSEGVSVVSENSKRCSVLVKYDANGKAQWVRTAKGGVDNSEFYSICSADGFIYTSGYQAGRSIFFYGINDEASRASRALTSDDDDDPPPDPPTPPSPPSPPAAPSSAPPSAEASSMERNSVIVCYSGDGTAQWAKTVSSGNRESNFYAVSGNGQGIFAAGTQFGTGIFSYGSGVDAQGINNGFNKDGSARSAENALVTRY